MNSGVNTSKGEVLMTVQLVLAASGMHAMEPLPTTLIHLLIHSSKRVLLSTWSSSSQVEDKIVFRHKDRDSIFTVLNIGMEKITFDLRDSNILKAAEECVLNISWEILIWILCSDYVKSSAEFVLMDSSWVFFSWQGVLFSEKKAFQLEVSFVPAWLGFYLFIFGFRISSTNYNIWITKTPQMGSESSLTAK